MLDKKRVKFDSPAIDLSSSPNFTAESPIQDIGKKGENECNTPASVDIYDYCPTQIPIRNSQPDNVLWDSPKLPTKINLAYDLDSQFVTEQNTPAVEKPLSISDVAGVQINRPDFRALSQSTVQMILIPKEDANLLVSTVVNTIIPSSKRELVVSPLYQLEICRIQKNLSASDIKILEIPKPTLNPASNNTQLELASFAAIDEFQPMDENISMISNTGSNDITKDLDLYKNSRISDQVLCELETVGNFPPSSFNSAVLLSTQKQKLKSQCMQPSSEYSALLASDIPVEDWPTTAQYAMRTSPAKLLSQLDHTSDIEFEEILSPETESIQRMESSQISQQNFEAPKDALDFLLPSPVRIIEGPQSILISSPISTGPHSTVFRAPLISQTSTDIEKTFIIHETCSLDSTMPDAVHLQTRGGLAVGNGMQNNNDLSVDSISMDDLSEFSNELDKPNEVERCNYRDAKPKRMPDFAAMSNIELLVLIA